MKNLLDKMKDAKVVSMPEHKMKAKMEVIKALKQLAQTLMMDDMGSKLMGKPESVEIEMISAEPMMSHDEAMDADMDKFPQKEETLLTEAMADEDEMEDMEDSDEDELRAMLAKSKESK